MFDTGQFIVKTEVGGSESEVKLEDEIYPVNDLDDQCENDASDNLNNTNENLQSLVLLESSLETERVTPKFWIQN